MKSLKRLLCLMLTLVIVAGIIQTVNADTIIFPKNYTSSDGKWIYSRNDTDDEAWLYRYLGDETNVVIPEEIDGFKIYAISSWCFYGKEKPSIAYDTVNVENNDRIKSIKIPSTIEIIGFDAFSYMDSLEEVSFDEHMNGSLYLNGSLFVSSPLLHKLRIPRYCSLDSSSNFLSSSSIKELEIPYVNISEYSGSDNLAFYLNPVENLIITGDYEFGELKGFFSSNSIKTVEIKGFVTGDNVTYDFYDIRNILRNKPDFIFHHIPSATVDVGLQEFGYVKSYDAETGFTTYSVNGIPDTAYSPVINNTGAVDELQSGDFSYTLTDSENAIIIGYSGNDNAVNFPAEIDSHTVIAIGADGFTISTGEAESIVIPDTVEYIANSAFKGNSALKHVSFSENLKIIEAQAFKDCSVKEVVLPNVVYVGEGAFENCLPNNIFIPSTLKNIPEKMFFENKGSTSSCLTEVIISEGVKSIGPDAFNYNYKHKDYGNSFTLTLPSSLEYIGDRAFYYAGIRGELVLPDNINVLSEYAFAYNKLSSILLPSNLERIEKCALRGNRYTEAIIIPEKVFSLDDYALSSLTVPEFVINAKISTFPTYCFYKLTAENIELPNGTKAIDDYAFTESRISNLDLPASLEEIAADAFRECKIGSLTFRCENLDTDYGLFNNKTIIESVSITENVKVLSSHIFQGAVISGEISVMPGVETIGKFAFYKSNIKEIVIPNTVKTISYKAFSDSQLTSIIIPESVTTLGGGAFSDNALLERVDYLSASCTLEPGDCYPFENCPELKEFNFGNDIKYIPDNLLRNCKGFESISIPEGVTDIGSYTFADTNLKTIVMPDSLESIGDSCFENCSEMKTVVINGNIFLIGDNTFNGCEKLKEIYISDSVKDIGRNSFAGCESLETVYMSKNVVYIPERCFESCTALSSFTWEADSKLIGKLAFAGCTSLETFNFIGIEKLYPNSFQGSGIGVASLGEAQNEAAATLEIVESQSFMDCPELQMVALGGNVSTVQTKAFANCENLETAIISDSVETISSDAFENCPKLTIYCSEDSYAYNYAKSAGIPVSAFIVEPIPNQTYTSKAIEPDVKVSVSGKPLSRGDDFKVKYSNNINVGTATVKVSGINTYKMFSSIVNFTILTRNISEASISDIADQTYTGNEITPSLTVSFNGKTLREGKDYEVIYTNNTATGVAKATVTGIGNFSGTKTAKFNITEDQTDNNDSSSTIVEFFRKVFQFAINLFSIILGFFK